jgi:hypothetical protein
MQIKLLTIAALSILTQWSSTGVQNPLADLLGNGNT